MKQIVGTKSYLDIFSDCQTEKVINFDAFTISHSFFLVIFSSLILKFQTLTECLL